VIIYTLMGRGIKRFRMRFHWISSDGEGVEERQDKS
jgi:hypothetical protein